MRFSFFISLIAISMSAWALDASKRQQIEERIRPIGQVNLALNKISGSTNPTPIETQTNPANETKGQATYEKYCSVCHRDGLAGAPKFRVAADWQPRLAKKNLEALLASALKGFNAMPIKGTCMECTEEELKDAIQYMLPRP